MGSELAFEGLLGGGIVGILSTMSVMIERVMVSQKDLQGMLEGGRTAESSQRVT